MTNPSENLESKELPFNSQKMIENLSRFSDLIQEKGVDPDDLEIFLNQLGKCGKSDDVIELLNTWMKHPLPSLVTYYVLTGHDDEVIENIIENYPDSLALLRSTFFRSQKEERAKSLSNRLVRQDIEDALAGKDKTVETEILNGESPDDEDFNPVKEVTGRFPVVNPANQKAANSKFKTITAKLMEKGEKIKKQESMEREN